MLPPSGHERDRRIRLILRAMGPRTTIGKTTSRIMHITTYMAFHAIKTYKLKRSAFW